MSVCEYRRVNNIPGSFCAFFQPPPTRMGAWWGVDLSARQPGSTWAQFILCTGGVYSELYMALLISQLFSPKACMDEEAGTGRLSSFMHLVPHPPQYGPWNPPRGRFTSLVYLWLTYVYAHVGMLVCTHIMLECTRRPLVNKTIYAPLIYTAPCVMLLMRALSITWARRIEGSWAGGKIRTVPRTNGTRSAALHQACFTLQPISWLYKPASVVMVQNPGTYTHTFNACCTLQPTYSDYKTAPVLWCKIPGRTLTTTYTSWLYKPASVLMVQNSGTYTHNEDSSAAQGHKWTLKSLWRHFDELGIDHTVVWEKIKVKLVSYP